MTTLTDTARAEAVTATARAHLVDVETRIRSGDPATTPADLVDARAAVDHAELAEHAARARDAQRAYETRVATYNAAARGILELDDHDPAIRDAYTTAVTAMRALWDLAAHRADDTTNALTAGIRAVDTAGQHDEQAELHTAGIRVVGSDGATVVDPDTGAVTRVRHIHPSTFASAVITAVIDQVEHELATAARAEGKAHWYVGVPPDVRFHLAVHARPAVPIIDVADQDDPEPATDTTTPATTPRA